MAQPRSNSELVSNLPFYAVKPSDDFPDWDLVTCQREDCGSKPFFVHRATWRKNRVVKGTAIVGRSCPYCMRVSRIPRGKRGQRRN